jgi:hypothetical protein
MHVVDSVYCNRKRIYGATPTGHQVNPNLPAFRSCLTANLGRSFFFHRVHINRLRGENPSRIGRPLLLLPAHAAVTAPLVRLLLLPPRSPTAPLRRAAAMTRGRREAAGAAGVGAMAGAGEASAAAAGDGGAGLGTAGGRRLGDDVGWEASAAGGWGRRRQRRLGDGVAGMRRPMAQAHSTVSSISPVQAPSLLSLCSPIIFLIMVRRAYCLSHVSAHQNMYRLFVILHHAQTCYWINEGSLFYWAMLCCFLLF